jgi:hypothetical protein
MPLSGQAAGLVVTAVSRLIIRASGCLAYEWGSERDKTAWEWEPQQPQLLHRDVRFR